MNDNPLQKYFRKPSVYIKLPSTDLAYSDTILNKNPTGEHAVYAMTALDEITAKTPDALLNGKAVADVIKSCIPDLQDPWQLLVQDLDAVLIAIRIASGDGSLDITSECPSCKTSNEYTIDLSGLLTSLKASDYDTPFHQHDLEFKFKSLTYKELNQISINQFDIQKMFARIDAEEDQDQKVTQSFNVINALNDLTMKMIAASVEYIKTPDTWVDDKNYIYDFLRNCDRRIFNSVKEIVTTMRETSSLKPLKVTCQNCGHMYDQTINMNISDFFE